ncbi:uncharacterized protein BO80DRAFT_428968 [Aspergillus ibericus CBS 121593]|uniref:Uncharacterized protein n=1 Tax=Aspergillus ibericus CBS 121593 TaxID=1448316 RepID=A0A395GMK2_9EURO|nr:hypothetical protein BO80DRAFT_428968 [Aspergillus ibericus CBS 121593]RAK96546.1 hypothetical protein BO80DRAFT_428968 [Aspergillus ibericus CBS 121593]
MGDAARPSDDVYQRVLQESLDTWSSYTAAVSDDAPFSREALDLQNLASQVPSFLGDGLISPTETIPFSCEEKPAAQGKGSLLVNGRSKWSTSRGTCDLPPIVLPKQLLLAVQSRLSVRLSEDAPLEKWPCVKGLEGYDNGNYLAVLYLAWAYILSVRWVEMLSRSADHESRMYYDVEISGAAPHPDERPAIQIDLGEKVSGEEALWWRNILSSDTCWDATTKYNGQVYLSPWSVSVKDVRIISSAILSVVNVSSPPSSAVALGYLTRFCERYGLYAQCSTALTGVLYIPFLKGKTISLPFPRQLSREQLKAHFSHRVSLPTIINLLETHKELLPKYMTLSSNPWGLRSLLCSTFFNPDIECNLASAWLNPAFAVLDSISSANPALIAAVLSKRQPPLGVLWLGAVCSDVAKPVLRDIRAGMVALDLPSSAWTGIPQTFLTSRTQRVNDESIRRDDECRLLFITATEGHDRPPIWPWKPFGVTQLSDTDLTVQEHAQCPSTHCLEYQSWEWLLSEDGAIQDFSKGNERRTYDITPFSTTQRNPSPPRDISDNLLSQSLSEIATRGIFQWLRSTGYPRNEKGIYQHSWVDMEGTDDEEPDDAESDVGNEVGFKIQRVENWLDGIEGCS